MSSVKSTKEFRSPMAERTVRLSDGAGGGPLEQELASVLDSLRDAPKAGRAATLTEKGAPDPYLVRTGGRLVYAGPVPEGDLVADEREDRLRELAE